MHISFLSSLILVIGVTSALATPFVDFVDPPLHPHEAKKHVGRFRDIIGEVTQVSVKEDGSVFLYFESRNSRPVFTALIPAEARYKFDGAAKQFVEASKPFVGPTGDPRKLVGKRVWMRGVIRNKRTPQMVVGDPGDFAVFRKQHLSGQRRREVTTIRVRRAELP